MHLLYLEIKHFVLLVYYVYIVLFFYKKDKIMTFFYLWPKYLPFLFCYLERLYNSELVWLYCSDNLQNSKTNMTKNHDKIVNRDIIFFHIAHP